MTTFLSGEYCPDCGTEMTVTDDGDALEFECPACGLTFGDDAL